MRLVTDPAASRSMFPSWSPDPPNGRSSSPSPTAEPSVARRDSYELHGRASPLPSSATWSRSARLTSLDESPPRPSPTASFIKRVHQASSPTASFIKRVVFESANAGAAYQPLTPGFASAPPIRPRLSWFAMFMLTLMVLTLGTVFGYHSAAPPPPPPHVAVYRAAGRPVACAGWEARCLRGADAAAAQDLSRFWRRSLCAEEPSPKAGRGQDTVSGELSCANRAEVWAAPSVALLPHAAQAAQRRLQPPERDGGETPTLVLFLPGTGTAPLQAQTLLEAAARAGHHVLGLSYTALPVAVAQLDIWCTRPGADSAACNTQLHEAVLFGTTTGEAAGGLWPVPRRESVASLAAEALRKLGWTQFLVADAVVAKGSKRRAHSEDVAWERVVVSGHSQGASHAAYLSVVRPVRAAVLLSGPQECPACGRDWVGAKRAAHTHTHTPVRRATYALREECGDEPYDAHSYCASLHPGLQRRNLQEMGLAPGLLGNRSGFIVLDFEPLVLGPGTGRSHHGSVALGKQAPPGVAAMWLSLYSAL
jgi:hypothetical protein